MPVLIISPNGTVTERPTLVVAVMEHVTQPDPHIINVLNKTMIITTSMAQTTTPIQVPAGVELKFANNAVYTIGTGQTLDLSLCEFQKPHYDCFINNGNPIIFPEAGPGPLQNWSIKNLIAAGTAAIAGVLSGLSAIFTGNVTAGSFTGPLTGNVTGNAATATEPNPAGHIVKSADVNQRTIRGSVAADGTGSGTGWTAVGAGAGISNITFNPAFAAIPTVVACIKDTTSSQAVISASTITASTCQIRRYSAVIGNLDAYQFNFIAIGTSL